MYGPLDVGKLVTKQWIEWGSFKQTLSIYGLYMVPRHQKSSSTHINAMSNHPPPALVEL